MKRLFMLVLLTLLCASAVFAQYPEVTIRQIQQVPMDSLLIADTLTNFSANSTQTRWTLQTSPYMGDTVTVTGIVVVPAFVITYTSAGWTMVLYDTTAAGGDAWRGILVRANRGDSTQLIADGFLSVTAGDVITMTGVVSEFPTSRGGSLTQFQPIAGHPIQIIGSAPVPKPVIMDAADIYKGIFPNGQVRYSTAEPYEGMIVELHNLTVGSKINLTRGTFSVIDAAGNEVSEYDMSRYFTLQGSSTDHPYPDTAWTRIYPTLGTWTTIDTIRGLLTTSSGSESPRGYRIAPLYYGDIVFGAVRPFVGTHRRNPIVVSPDSLATISVKASQQPGGAPLKDVTLYYSVDNSAFTSLPMAFRASDTTYVAQIPQQAANAFVRYFMAVTDSAGQSATLANSALTGLAADTSKGFFFYTVLNRPLTIRDVQYTPYINGRSGYLGAVISLSGILTADTAHIGLSALTNGGTNAWYMQSTNQPWSGIWLSTVDTNAQKRLSLLHNGDSVTVTGTVQEQFDVTRIGNITVVTKNGSGKPEPTPVVLHTGDFNVGNGTPSAEPYEGMLVRFNNLTISDINPTYSDQTEFSVNDGTGAIVVRRDGRNSFSNMIADTAYGKTIVKVGDKLSSLTGIIYYSFNQYKIVPRTDADFGTLTAVAEPTRQNEIPTSYALDQNYPNPFNPSTIIRYSVPQSGLVTLKVYNILGQEVGTLVNGFQNVGVYTVRFDASSLATGIYFCRIQAGKFTAVKKMMLLK